MEKKMMQTVSLAGRRRTFIGGSDARIIMGNDEAGLLRLWREKRGDEVCEDTGARRHHRCKVGVVLAAFAA